MKRSTRLSTGAVAPVSYAPKISLSGDDFDTVTDDDASHSSSAKSSFKRALRKSMPSTSASKANNMNESESESESDSSSASEEDDFDEYGKVNSALKKKHAAIKQEQREKAKSENEAAARGSNLLASLLSLPLEILSIIFTFTDPAALWSLSVTNKYWYNILWSRKSLPIWRAMIESLTFEYYDKVYELPPPPNGICEPAWIATIMVPRCMACNGWTSPECGVALFINLCTYCAREILLSKVKIQRRLASLGKPKLLPWMFKLCMPHNFRRREYKTVYSLWEVEKMLGEFDVNDAAEFAWSYIIKLQQERYFDPVEMKSLSEKVTVWHQKARDYRDRELALRVTARKRLVEAFLSKILSRFTSDPGYDAKFTKVIEYCYTENISKSGDCQIWQCLFHIG